jgi:hypothetical protein
MPPKPAAAKGGKEKSKADLAKKQKLVEDKTFGLKNKNKSKNVQKFVQSLTQSVQPNPKQTDAKAALKVSLYRHFFFGLFRSGIASLMCCCVTSRLV